LEYSLKMDVSVASVGRLDGVCLEEVGNSLVVLPAWSGCLVRSGDWEMNLLKDALVHGVPGSVEGDLENDLEVDRLVGFEDNLFLWMRLDDQVCVGWADLASGLQVAGMDFPVDLGGVSENVLWVFLGYY